MPTCSRCSAEIADDSRFCSRCGAPSVSDASGATMAMSPSSARLRPPSDPSSLGHGRFEPGTRLGSRYRVVGLLGRGGMGEVYRADDLDLGQSVALKFLPERIQHDAAALGRLRGEVRLARQVAHPNVGRVYDIGEADGLAFITMEYVDGEDLASVLRRMGRPSRDKAVEIARQLCVGLAAAHDRGVLHRDLKPSNVMIDGRGRVRIMDFGLAALADDAAAGAEIVGTPAYMAPEQLASGQVSVQSDLYSLGLVIYEVFTGRPAHATADPAELSRRHASGSVATPSSVVDDMDPAAERVVMRCLETEPRLRPASAYAVLGALPGGDPLAAALAAGETPSPELVANAAEGGGLSPRLAFGGMALALVAVILAVAMLPDLYRTLRQSPGALSYRAVSVLGTFGYDSLPRHTAMGFAYRPEVADRVQALRRPADSLATAGAGGVFFWRRFGRQALVPLDIHRSVVTLTDPPQAAGGIAIMLDPAGRLLGLEVASQPGRGADRAAPDSAGGARARTDWGPLVAAAGLDPAALAPDPRAWSPPVICDTTASWTVRATAPHAGTWTAHAGAWRGRPVYFSLADSLGSVTGVLDRPASEEHSAAGGWIDMAITLLSVAGAAILARRNLRLGRGDRRGAFRLATFVAIATALETVFTWSVPERGLRGLLESLVDDRALGHALIHGGVMWISYMALEPYVRRLWPRMLVSWARLASGRLRDPMVGRDVLAGIVLGAASVVLTLLGLRLNGLVTAVNPMALVGTTHLAAFATLSGLAFGTAYAGSVSVLSVLTALVFCVLVRLATRRDLATIVVAGAITSFWGLLGAASPLTDGSLVVGIVGGAVTMFALFRIGLLAALVANFANMVLLLAPPTADPASWTGVRGLLVVALLVAGIVLAGWVALAGQPLFEDVLAERRPPRA